MKLYTYWRSLALYRVRIALELEGVPYKSCPVHLMHSGDALHGRGVAPHIIESVEQAWRHLGEKAK